MTHTIDSFHVIREAAAKRIALSKGGNPMPLDALIAHIMGFVGSICCLCFAVYEIIEMHWEWAIMNLLIGVPCSIINFRALCMAWKERKHDTHN